MGFNELNSVEHYIIHQLSGVNLNSKEAHEPQVGYGAQWVTEWYAYNDKRLRALGGNPEADKFAGFIYIGTKNEDPKERRRPDKKDVVSYYTA